MTTSETNDNNNENKKDTTASDEEPKAAMTLEEQIAAKIARESTRANTNVAAATAVDHVPEIREPGAVHVTGGSLCSSLNSSHHSLASFANADSKELTKSDDEDKMTSTTTKAKRRRSSGFRRGLRRNRSEDGSVGSGKAPARLTSMRRIRSSEEMPVPGAVRVQSARHLTPDMDRKNARGGPRRKSFSSATAQKALVDALDQRVAAKMANMDNSGRSTNSGVSLNSGGNLSSGYDDSSAHSVRQRMVDDLDQRVAAKMSGSSHGGGSVRLSATQPGAVAVSRSRSSSPEFAAKMSGGKRTAHRAISREDLDQRVAAKMMDNSAATIGNSGRSRMDMSGSTRKRAPAVPATVPGAVSVSTSRDSSPGATSRTQAIEDLDQRVAQKMMDNSTHSTAAARRTMMDHSANSTRSMMNSSRRHLKQAPAVPATVPGAVSVSNSRDSSPGATSRTQAIDDLDQRVAQKMMDNSTHSTAAARRTMMDHSANSTRSMMNSSRRHLKQAPAVPASVPGAVAVAHARDESDDMQGKQRIGAQRANQSIEDLDQRVAQKMMDNSTHSIGNSGYEGDRSERRTMGNSSARSRKRIPARSRSREHSPLRDFRRAQQKGTSGMEDQSMKSRSIMMDNSSGRAIDDLDQRIAAKMDASGHGSSLKRPPPASMPGAVAVAKGAATAAGMDNSTASSGYNSGQDSSVGGGSSVVDDLDQRIAAKMSGSGRSQNLKPPPPPSVPGAVAVSKARSESADMQGKMRPVAHASLDDLDQRVAAKMRDNSCRSLISTHSSNNYDDRVAAKMMRDGSGPTTPVNTRRAVHDAIDDLDQRVAAKMRDSGSAPSTPASATIALVDLDQRVAAKLSANSPMRTSSNVMEEGDSRVHRALMNLDQQVDAKIRSMNNNNNAPAPPAPAVLPGGRRANESVNDWDRRVAAKMAQYCSPSETDLEAEEEAGDRHVRDSLDNLDQQVAAKLHGQAPMRAPPQGLFAMDHNPEPGSMSSIMNGLDPRMEAKRISDSKMLMMESESSILFNMDNKQADSKNQLLEQSKRSSSKMLLPEHKRGSGGSSKMLGDDAKNLIEMGVVRLETAPGDQNLAVATAVEEGSSHEMELPMALPTDPDAKPQSENVLKRRAMLQAGRTCVCIFILLVVAIVVPAVVLTRPDVKDALKNETIAGPTPEEILDPLLPNYTMGEIFRGNGTPQALAYEWMLQDPVLMESNMSSDRIYQRFALATLYYATKGDGWFNSTHWLDYDVHECHWFAAEGHKGVAPNPLDDYQPVQIEHNNPCEMPPSAFANISQDINGSLYEIDEEYNQEYVHLWLASNNLDGSIPPELFWLTSLKSLSLRLNLLQGSIPTEIGLLTDLEAVSFAGTQELTGSLPSEIGGLANLTSFVAWWNQLTGTLPTQLGQLSNLHEMFLDSNALTGTLPDELGGLSGIHWLYLYDNAFTGTFPMWATTLPEVEELVLFMNALTGTIPSEVGLLSNLVMLQLYTNQFTGTIPSELGQLTDAFFIFMDDNMLTGYLPSELGNCAGLGSMYTSYNQLSGSIPSELGRLSWLFNMELSFNALSGTIPTELGLLPANWSVVPTDIAQLDVLQVGLADNQLTGPIPSELGQRAGLEILLLQNNDLSGEVPSELGLMVNLTSFNISNNPLLSGEVPDSLCGFQDDGFQCSDSLSGCSCGSSSAEGNSTRT